MRAINRISFNMHLVRVHVMFIIFICLPSIVCARKENSNPRLYIGVAKPLITISSFCSRSIYSVDQKEPNKVPPVSSQTSSDIQLHTYSYSCGLSAPSGIFYAIWVYCGMYCIEHHSSYAFAFSNNICEISAICITHLVSHVYGCVRECNLICQRDIR